MDWNDGQLDKALAKLAQFTKLPYGGPGDLSVIVQLESEEAAQEANRVLMASVLNAAWTYFPGKPPDPTPIERFMDYKADTRDVLGRQLS